MDKKILTILISSCILLSWVVGFAADEATPTLDWSVIASGGGTSQAAAYTLSSTIGQAVVGQSSVSTLNLCVGFWCSEVIYRLFLPLILRGG